MNSSLEFFKVVFIVIFILIIGVLIDEAVRLIFNRTEIKEQVTAEHFEKIIQMKDNTIDYLQKDIEFWRGNCETAETKYNKLKEKQNETVKRY